MSSTPPSDPAGVHEGDGAGERVAPPQRPDTALLIIGLALILLPLVFVVVAPHQFETAQFYLRVVASLGGALVGASLPGLLHINIPGVRAGGALAVLVLLFLFNPPQRLADARGPEPVPGVVPPISNPIPEKKKDSPPPPVAAPEPVCSFVPIKSLGWKEGHKTNYCKFHGYELGNFNQGDISNGGICMTGREPDVCKAKVLGTLSDEFRCETEGLKTSCYRK